MKAFTWIALCVLLGCRDQSDLKPNQLIGTWNLTSGQLLNRWTFAPEYVYSAKDTLTTCAPAESYPHKYWLEKDILVLRYAGITNGLVPIPDVRYSIISLSERDLVIIGPDKQRHEFQKCD